jgi:glucosamine-6-phosphate deaminase
VTVGVGTIRDYSKQVVMVAHGAPKARAVRRVTEADSYRPDWPATILADCARPLLFVDEAAASELNGRRQAETNHRPKETQWLG